MFINAEEAAWFLNRLNSWEPLMNFALGFKKGYQHEQRTTVGDCQWEKQPK